MHTRPTRLTWDLFCHVIDNWGDLGVCWRLAHNLALRGQNVRLWADDPSPLSWMAPGAIEGGWPDIEVRHWPRLKADAPAPELPPADVLIEAFGCEINPAWVQRLLPATLASQPQRVWINLEYLSAEPYVERCHRLPSPVLNGPLSGRTKWFFYPGFTPSTGGLLREPGLCHTTFEHTTVNAASLSDDMTRITLFSYESPALSALLRHPDLQKAHWQITPGRSAAAFAAVRHALPAGAQATWLPHVAQADFDACLQHSHLNCVRGEDSLVRALWAGQALLWQIYPQGDNAHHAKLDAFLDWLQAPPDLRQWHHAWNGMCAATQLPRLAPDTLAAWRDTVLAARQRLLEQRDLTQQLMDFVAEKR